MAPPVRLWIETTYHVAFRYGGWAWAREADGQVSGAAGGERTTTAERIALSALIAALEGLPAGSTVMLQSASPSLLAAARRLPQTDSQAPEGDLWARFRVLAAARAITLQAAASEPRTPAAFLAAWAEVGQDKAKGPGRFAAAIPKPNLAKLTLS